MHILQPLLLFAAITSIAAPRVLAADPPRPNILWITSEDHGPHMGCYGDRFATTPHMDALAAKGLVYTRCWSNAPVCAPARTTLICGMYPPSLGAEHMRSLVACPQGKRLFPQFLRDAGYYYTNNAKEDYNVSQPGRVWDESSKTAHWKNRRPGQPFFAVFNSAKSHESKLRIRPHRQIHDPERVRVPAYHPDTPEVRQDYGQHLNYMWETPTTRVWERLFREGQLNTAQAAFWKTKPPEELYALQTDPDEVHNLASSPEDALALAKLRAALQAHLASIRDVGFLPEGEMHRRSTGSTPYDIGHDPAKYPVDRILETANAAASLKPEDLPRLKAALADSDCAVRYWAVLGMLMRGADAVNAARDELITALDDTSPDVQVAAAEALGRYGNDADLARCLLVLREHADWNKHDVFTVMSALNSVTALGRKADSIRAAITALPAQGPAPDPRYQEYVPKLLESLRAADRR